MRDKKFIREVLRFGTVGGIGFGVNYGLLLLLNDHYQINHIVSEIVAMAVALQITFVLHDSWTYREKATNREGYHLSLRVRYSSYVLSNTTGAVITVVSYALLYGWLHRFFALAVAAVLGMLWNFCMNRFYIWKRHDMAIAEEIATR